MKKTTKNLMIGLTGLAIVFFAVSCNPKPKGPMGPPMGFVPTVSVTSIKDTRITETDEYIGKVNARDTVDIVARVNGYLKKHYFTEGAIVNKGSLLFLIEPDQYQAEVEQANADIENIKASLIKDEKNLKRTKELIDQDFISHSSFDQALATRDKTTADLKSKEALLKKSKLNLSYTKIYAPITGKIGSLQVTEGNYVGPNSGVLATIVKLNPIFVTYNIPADDFTRLRLKFSEEGKSISNHEVDLVLANDTTYSYKGLQNFFDNKVDDSTGTIKMRAEFPNPEGILLPGQLGKVIVYANSSVIKHIIPQAIVLEDSVGKYVYVVDDNKVKVQRIKTGKQVGKDIIVESGLSRIEKIISSGLQKLRPGMEVKVSTEAPEKTEDKGKTNVK